MEKLMNFFIQNEYKNKTKCLGMNGFFSVLRKKEVCILGFKFCLSY